MRIKNYFLRAVLVLYTAIISSAAYSQIGQISISRIGQMPNLPSPLIIKDWDAITTAYDSYIFDLDKTGQYLPLVRIGSQGQFNYPDNTPIFLDTYVGGNSHLNVAEAINIMPAIIGASLIGIDKSNQDGHNWVAMSKDFYNSRNNQNVYLNNYSTSSGGDWWYDLMPNVYFYQMRSIYPDGAPEFDDQFTTVADQWLYCVNQLGGSSTPWSIPNMNHRAFNLHTGQPNSSGVAEPESAGTIAWLLYNAWLNTGNRKYIEGAQQALDFLQEWQTNPSYELQLPYGTLIASRMNAEKGTNYDIDKMLNWCFNRGPLRGWGAIVGNWGGYDVSGLIGEANDNGNDYAFVMNGFQQAAALAPLPKYDKRYARDIAKWILNMANASRLFYRTELPQENQDSYEWSLNNDPQAVIPHESMKEVWLGKSPFARGDAINGGWAATNLSLYSGSSVGYLAAAIDHTNVDGILQIDLNRTDFYGQNTLPSYLYYNPFDILQQVNVTLPEGSWGVYETLTETILTPMVSGQLQLSVPPGEARLIRLYNSDATPVQEGSKMMVEDEILDFNFGYDFTALPRIKGLAIDQNPVLTNSTFLAYCTVENTQPGTQAQYTWFINDTQVATGTNSQTTLTAPATEGLFVLKCMVLTGDVTIEDTLNIHAVQTIPVPPVVTGIQSETPYIATDGTNILTALTEPAPGEILSYSWDITGGTLTQNTENSVIWQAPGVTGVYSVNVEVTNQDNASTTVSGNLLVKDTGMEVKDPIIWYPLDYNEQNFSRNDFHALRQGVTKTEDARLIPSLAAHFTQGSDIIYTPNKDELNFGDAVAISCWIKCEQLGSERYIISHGSYQQRYKLSVTPEGYIRWTIKTSSGITDLDGSFVIELDRYYHVTAVYTGYSMELYIDGVLDSFDENSGILQQADKNLTIGRVDNTETLYSWRGAIDEVKIWDTEISPLQISELKNQWATGLGDKEIKISSTIWPNPSTGSFRIELNDTHKISDLKLYSYTGQAIPFIQESSTANGATIKIVNRDFSGMCLLVIITDDGTVHTSNALIN